MKINTWIILLFFVCNATAQTQKGSWTFGGSAGINFNSNNSTFKSETFESESDKETQFSFVPGAGYFVLDNFAVGLQLQLSTSKTERFFNFNNSILETEFTTNNTSVNPYLRYYFGSNTIKPYIQGQIGFGSSKVNSKNSSAMDQEFKNKLFLFGGFGGVAFFINEHVSLDVGVSYTSTTLRDKDSYNNDRTVSNNVLVGAGFNIFL